RAWDRVRPDHTTVLTIAPNARTARPRRWPNFRRRIIRRDRNTGRRSMFQHFDDRLSGSADGPILSWANRGHDLSTHWKLRHERDRSGKYPTACARVHYRRAEQNPK